jgi:hypothetical protein
VNLRVLPLTALAFLTACQNMPEPYAPPEQRQPFENFRPYRISRVVNMADGDVDAHIVSGITQISGGSWRWAEQRPTVRLTVRSADHLKYTIDFTIAGTTFDQTGPVTVSFFVNDHQIGSERYTAQGNQHYETPVPDGLVEANKEVTVAAEIDKLFTPPEGGQRLGFILTRIGLKQE